MQINQENIKELEDIDIEVEITAESKRLVGFQIYSAFPIVTSPLSNTPFSLASMTEYLLWNYPGIY